MLYKTIIQILFLLLLMGSDFTATAQKMIKVSGKVTDAETGVPLMYASITSPELGTGTTTNEKGEFSFTSIPQGKYTFSVTYISYAEFSFEAGLDDFTGFNIKLNRRLLGLNEITVTAVSSKKGTTSSLIKNDAIEHVQASSIKDVLQLIPGNISENPNLSGPSKISIRETKTDINSALGAALIIDNIPVSNDGNLQKSIETSGFSTVAGTGYDLRSIPVENIESITVDVGIPSVEHGNLTSGAVHVKTKTGGSPYNVKLKADPHIKEVYLGKGYLLNNDNGVVNFDMGYTQSYKHLVKQTDFYKRINASAKYSKTFFREHNPLQIDIKLDLLNSLDNKKKDPNMILDEKIYSKNQELRANLSAGWMFSNAFFSNLSFDFGFEKAWQEGFEKTWEQSSSGPNFFTTATQSGEFEISYAPSAYYAEVTYDGRPFSIYSKLKGKFHKKTGPLSNNVLLGAEWRTTGNDGQGRIFDPNRPPSGVGSRPRPFTDIPSLNQFSLFAEDNIRLKLGKTNLYVMAGIRLDNIQPDGFFNTNGSIGADPRINISYEILNRDNNPLFSNFNLRAGYGQTTKAPTLLHLYPDKKYNDVQSFNYYPNLIVYTTHMVEDTQNFDLKPSTGDKFEAGFDFETSFITGRITWFYENFKGGFLSDLVLYPLHYREYFTINAGLSPYYIPGTGVFYNSPDSGEPIAVGYENDVKFAQYEVIRNASQRIKKGVEYNFSLGTIRSIRTSFNFIGAWFFTESFSDGAPYWERVYYTTYSGNSSTQESFAVKFPDRYGYGITEERINTNISIINHIPELKLLVSLNAQIIWTEKDQRKIYADKYKLYGLDELRKHLGNPSLFSNDTENNYYYFLPVSYKLYDNIEHEYTVEKFQESFHQNAIKKLPKYRFAKETLPVLPKLDIKISKDIGSNFKLSFYANNFLNIRPWYLNKREGTYIRRNQVPYFGADIKFQF